MSYKRFVLVLLLLGGFSAALAQGDTTPDFDSLSLELVADGFVSPVALTGIQGDDRLFVVDRVGQVWVVSQAGERSAEPFLDIADRLVELTPGYDERGLLGFAFHPDFANNGRAFAYYSAPLRAGAPEGWNHTTILSEFDLDESGMHLDPASEKVLIEVDEPQMNHNGGTVLFGTDGYLYLSLGDGGGANDVGDGHPPLGNGQDVTTLKGSILRIDIDADDPRGYGIPEGNPFANGVTLPDGYQWQGDQAHPEIYLWGVRNPYRFSVDLKTGALLVADVGQNLWEEVDYVTGPGNLGWHLREGLFAFDPDNANAVLTEGPNTGPMGETFVEPVLTYAHPGVAASLEGHENFDIEERGISISGGYIYRGSAMPGLQGYYVFGDWSQSFSEPTGKMFVASTPEAGGEWAFVLDRQLDEFLLALGEDGHGEIYYLTTLESGPSGDTGKVYRLVGGN